MRIIDVREMSVPLMASGANAVVSFDSHTVSFVAVISDQKPNEKPQRQREVGHWIKLNTPHTLPATSYGRHLMSDIFDMTGKRVLITGGATGLGLVAASALARYGAEVILGARRINRVEESVASIQSNGGRAKGISLDVSDADSVSGALATILEDGRIDVLINNAGVVGDKMLIEETEADWDRIYNTNLRAIFTLSQRIAKAMAGDQAGGNIINMASILGYTTQKGTATYASAKAALIQLTRSMAVEWARYNVRVNAIAPGYFRTELADDWLDSEGGQNMIKRAPLRRIGVPSELEGVVLLLASSAGSYMTGSVVTVDGGLSIPQI